MFYGDGCLTVDGDTASMEVQLGEAGDYAMTFPAAVPLHQRVLGNLHLVLRAAEAPGTEVFVAPLDWQPDRRTSLQPDILVVPNLDSGNSLYKSLVYLGGAACAGLVMGACVPVILTSRADSEQARVASCALAALVADR